MTEFVYVYTGISAAEHFARLLTENCYADITVPPSKFGATTLKVFQINTRTRTFIRLHYAAEECLTTEDFIDLFL